MTRVGRAGVAAAIALAALTLAACSARLEPESALTEARELIARGEAGEARILMKNLLVQHPDATAARFLLARIALDAGDAKAADDELAAVPRERIASAEERVVRWQTDVAMGRAREVLEALERDGDSLSPAQRARLRAAATRQIGLAGDAIADLRAALAAQPGDSGLLGDLAMALTATGNAALAERELDAHLASKPRDADVLLMRGELRLRRGAVEPALADLQAAIAAAPPSWPLAAQVGARVLAADALLTLARMDDARKAIADFSRQFPGSGGARLLEARLALVDGRPGEAVDLLQQMAEQNPDNARVEYLLVDALLASGNFTRATDLLEKRVQASPQDATARRLLARLMLEQNRPDRVVELLGEPAEGGAVAPTDPLLSAARQVRERASVAIAELQARATAAPADAAVRAELAAAHLANGDPTRALALLRAMRSPTASPLGAATLVAALRATGNDRELNLLVDSLVGAQANSSLDVLLAAADAARQGDRPDVAARLLDAALVRDPQNVGALLRLAELRYGARDYAGADELLGRLETRLPGDASVKLARARLFEAQERRDDARRLLTAAVREQPADALLGLGLAGLELRAGQPAAAASAIDALIAAAPTDGRAAGAAGLLLLEARRADEARMRFATATAQAPAEASHWFNLGRTQLALGDEATAAQSFARVLALRPDAVEAGTIAVRLALARSDAAAARRIADGLVEQAPNQPLVWILAGQAALAEGRFEDASRAFGRSYGLRATPVAALGDFEARVRGGLPKAAAPVETWLGVEPEDAATRHRLAGWLLQSGRGTEAIGHLEKLVTGRPNDVIALNNLAWLLVERDPARAEVLARRAYAVAPASAAVADTLGWVLINRGKSQEARAILEQAVKASPRDPGVRYHYALALARIGDREAARTELQTALGSGTAFSQRAEAQALAKELSP